MREVTFLVRSDSLFEAYEKIVVKCDTAKFVNPGQLKLLGVAFVAGACGN